MGRAAHRKSQRHQMRTWQTRNPWTGERETFPVCVDDEALGQWERHRVRLAAAGYPDRPPEFDSPNLRAWSAVPGTPVQFRARDAAQSAAHLGGDPEAHFLGSWRSWKGERGVKILVGRRDDGIFVLKFVFESLTDHVSVPAWFANAEEARAAIEDFSRTVLPEFGLPPLHFTSAEAMLAETR